MAQVTESFLFRWENQNEFLAPGVGQGQPWLLEASREWISRGENNFCMWFQGLDEETRAALPYSHREVWVIKDIVHFHCHANHLIISIINILSSTHLWVLATRDLFFKRCINLPARQNYREREMCYLLIHSQNGCSDRNWASLKLGGRRFF